MPLLADCVVKTLFHRAFSDKSRGKLQMKTFGQTVLHRGIYRSNVFQQTCDIYGYISFLNTVHQFFSEDCKHVKINTRQGKELRSGLFPSWISVLLHFFWKESRASKISWMQHYIYSVFILKMSRNIVFSPVVVLSIISIAFHKDSADVT